MKKIIGIIIGAFILIPIIYFINLEILKIYLTFIILIAMLVIVIFFLINIQAKPPITTTFNCIIREEKYMNRKVFVIKSKNNDSLSNKYIFYLHGGAYVMEATYKHWQFLEDIVNETGMTLILPDYPLLPKNTYKEVFEMVTPLYKDVIKKYGKDNVIAMGDSAGGGMLLGLLEQMGLEKFAQPYKTILLSPWLDVRMINPEIDKVQKNDPILIKDPLKAVGKAYAGEDGMDTFLVNPILGPLEKLENLTIYTGTYDILNPDVHEFMKKAEEVNLKVDLREKPKAIHIWMTHVENKKVYAAKEAFQDIIELLKEDVN